VVTAIYAIVLTGFFLVLSWRVIATRRGEQITYGDNDSKRVHARIRAHANWAEYVPIALLLMFLAEYQGISVLWLHVYGIILTVGRVLHGVGMAFVPRLFQLRVYGMLLTLIALPIGMILNLTALF